MLNCAAVRSAVMQSAMAAEPFAAPMCDGGMAMTGMASDGGQAVAARTLASSAHDHGGRPQTGRKSACPYCAAAAHAPLLATAAPVRASSACVFAAYRVVALHGPRGPPALQPRARGPPPAPLTA